MTSPPELLQHPVTSGCFVVAMASAGGPGKQVQGAEMMGHLYRVRVRVRVRESLRVGQSGWQIGLRRPRGEL